MNLSVIVAWLWQTAYESYKELFGESNSTQASAEEAFHSLVFAWKTSASTLAFAATTSRVKLVQWSQLGVHRRKIERLFLPKALCDQKKKTLKAPRCHGMQNTHPYAALFSYHLPFLLSLRECTSVRSCIQTHTCTMESRWAKADVGSVFSTGSWFGGAIRLAFLRGDRVRES